MVNTIDVKIIQPLFKEYGIQYAGLFGSYARDEARPDSDVDILVRLGKPLTLPMFIRLENDLAHALNKKVDLVTERSLKQRLRETVMSEVKSIYGKN